jgi:hypothetical protein
MAQELDAAEKGRRFQAEVKKFVEEVIGENLNVKVVSEQPVQGISHPSWEVDIAVMGKLLGTNGFSMYLAVISCKHVKESVNPATYWTEMSRTYMELNDLKLNSELCNPKFFLVVNRYCVKGEMDKNYPLLFKNIGVEMINFNNSIEREKFASQLFQQSSKANPSEQVKGFEDLFKHRK